MYADKAYIDCEYEAWLRRTDWIFLRPLRKKNSQRPFEPWLEYIQKQTRQRIETSFSQITWARLRLKPFSAL